MRQELVRKRKELTEAEKVAMRTRCNEKVRCIKQEITTLVNKENRLWFQRSKVLWAKFGDRNSKFYHCHASQRKRKNLIHKIRDNHGDWILDKDKIVDVLVHYYKDLFMSANTLPCDLATNTIPKVINAEMNSKLYTAFS